MRGIVHTISKEDIPLPETCIYLGIQLDYYRPNKGEGIRYPHSPTIDRIDPNIGYIPGNIQVISDLANRMKQNASPEQLIAFARGILLLHAGERPVVP